MSKKLVFLTAPLLTLSGYGTHSRQIGEWLLRLEREGIIELYCEPVPWGNTPWIVDMNRDPTLHDLMQRCKALPKSQDGTVKKPDVSVQVKLPNEWNSQLAHVNIGVTAAVETNVAYPAWVEACRNMDAVVFPSHHSMMSVINAGLIRNDDKIFVVPESFPREILQDVNTHLFDPLPPFTFLMFGQMTDANNHRIDRKNLHKSIEWTLEEFADDSDVGVLLKTNIGRNNTFDRYHTETIIKSIVGHLKKKHPEKKFPEIHLVHGDVPDNQLGSLYRHPHVKALVTATRGEGFGLPILEAAACDLPVIATGWSGHVEFLQLGRYVDLPFKLQQIPKERIDKNIFTKEAQWAEVSEGDFKRRIRKFRESSSIPREWARDLGVKIRENYSIDAVCKAWDSKVGFLVRR